MKEKDDDDRIQKKENRKDEQQRGVKTIPYGCACDHDKHKRYQQLNHHSCIRWFFMISDIIERMLVIDASMDEIRNKHEHCRNDETDDPCAQIHGFLLTL